MPFIFYCYRFGKFKKIANSMTKLHCMFFVHRMILRRNRYTAKCRRENRTPLLPGINLCGPKFANVLGPDVEELSQLVELLI